MSWWGTCTRICLISTVASFVVVWRLFISLCSSIIHRHRSNMLLVRFDRPPSELLWQIPTVNLSKFSALVYVDRPPWHKRKGNLQFSYLCIMRVPTAIKTFLNLICRSTSSATIDPIDTLARQPVTRLTLLTTLLNFIDYNLRTGRE